jgi:Protein of unknown function (DUF3102)
MSPATRLETPPEDLAELAAGIKRQHEACQAAIKSGLEHAFACGSLLNQAKAKLGHGKWLPWLRQECPKIKTRTAQACMRLAAHRPEIEAAAKNATIAHLTINAALALIAPKFVTGKEPAAEALERERQAQYERELEREMSRVAAYTAPCIELAHHAHTLPFECSQSYDDEEEAKESAGGKSFEALQGDLCAALAGVSRIVSDIRSKRREMPEEPYSPDEKLPRLLAATIKNLQDLEQALHHWAAGRSVPKRE